MHSAPSRDFPITPLRPLLVLQQHRHRAALVGVRARQTMRGVGTNAIEDRVALRSLVDFGYAGLLAGAKPHKIER